ncbi:hypothetical protein RUND412_000011 [Rhizina undulata]
MENAGHRGKVRSLYETINKLNHDRETLKRALIRQEQLLRSQQKKLANEELMRVSLENHITETSRWLQNFSLSLSALSSHNDTVNVHCILDQAEAINMQSGWDSLDILKEIAVGEDDQGQGKFGTTVNEHIAVVEKPRGEATKHRAMQQAVEESAQSSKTLETAPIPAPKEFSKPPTQHRPPTETSTIEALASGPVGNLLDHPKQFAEITRPRMQTPLLPQPDQTRESSILQSRDAIFNSPPPPLRESVRPNTTRKRHPNGLNPPKRKRRDTPFPFPAPRSTKADIGRGNISLGSKEARDAVNSYTSRITREPGVRNYDGKRKRKECFEDDARAETAGREVKRRGVTKKHVDAGV